MLLFAQKQQIPRLVLMISRTDIDEKSLQYAKQNIIRNDLKPRIRPLLASPEDPLIPLERLGLEE